MWFDAQAELIKLAGDRENDAHTPATLATSATLRARVAIVADVAASQPQDVQMAEALVFAEKALVDCDAATDVANILLAHLRQCDTREAVFAFLATYQTAIDALEAHAPVRKIHVQNLADYKISNMKKGGK
jgi:hypothetical protein